jgi:hypothetical protein
VGHEVKLTGNWQKPTAGEAGGAGPAGKTMRTFTAVKITHVADTCTAAGKTVASTQGGPHQHKGAKKGAAAPESSAPTPQ